MNVTKKHRFMLGAAAIVTAGFVTTVAAQAAERAGDQIKAKKYFARLVAVCAKGDRPGRADLAVARQQ